MRGTSLRNIQFAALLVFGLAVAVSVSALEQDEARFGALINAERAARGFPTLEPDTELLTIARDHSEEMAGAGRIYHNSSLGSQVTRWNVLGENVGRGPDVDQIHQAFMESAVHREQILDPEYRGYAVGTVTSGGYIWVTELFILREQVAVLGRSAPKPPEPKPNPQPEPQIAAPEPQIAAPEPVLVKSIETPPALTLPLRLEVRLERQQATLRFAALAFLLLAIDAHFFKLIASRSFRRRMTGAGAAFII